jgi:hypothetical protein
MRQAQDNVSAGTPEPADSLISPTSKKQRKQVM